MSTVHFLNVAKGDCTLIQHNSTHNSLIDICKGNYDETTSLIESKFAAIEEEKVRVKGDFGMSARPTNPISYLQQVGVKSLFRFILTHPDMDHLDGLNALMDSFDVSNFWDSGVRKAKPNFLNSLEYKEEDWDRYESVCNGAEDLKVIRHLAGSKFKFANKSEDEAGGGDGLYILSPDKALVAAANEDGDVNDGSYVLLYRSRGGRILIPGDAHDETWEYVTEHYKRDVENCSVLFAPHHGRKSGRNFDFLDIVKPKVTFFGCASSGHLAYNAWYSRNLPVITNNQAGNIVLECKVGEIDIYVENSAFAEAANCNMDATNAQGYVYFDSIDDASD